MFRAFAAVFVLGSFSAQVTAGSVFDFVVDRPVDGLQFGVGQDLILTNSLVMRGTDTTPLYLNVGVGFDHVDGAGDYFFRPRLDIYQLYVLDKTLESPGLGVVASGLPQGISEAVNLGGGHYSYTGALIGAVGPAFTPPDSFGVLQFDFDLNRELGFQVTSGSLDFTGPLSLGGVPEPSSWFLVMLGLVGVFGVSRLGKTREFGEVIR